MALRTLSAGTLSAVTFSGSPQVLLPADLAQLAQMILDDVNPTHPMLNGAFDLRGILCIPNRLPRGMQVYPGDIVAVDSAGWPILVSANSLASGAWTLS